MKRRAALKLAAFQKLRKTAALDRSRVRWTDDAAHSVYLDDILSARMHYITRTAQTSFDAEQFTGYHRRIRTT